MQKTVHYARMQAGERPKEDGRSIPPIFGDKRPSGEVAYLDGVRKPDGNSKDTECVCELCVHGA